MSYLSTVIADSPLHYWRCADGGGTLEHDIGSAPRHLGSLVFAGTGYSGPSSDGGAVQTLANNGFPQSGDNLAARISPFSLEVWFWPLTIPGGAAVLLGWGAPGANTMLLVYNPALTLNINFNAALVGPAGAFAVQRWHQAVATYDGVTAKLYGDGALIANAAQAGPITITQPVAIGAIPAAANVFNGFLSEAAIFPAALTAAQVLAHFNAADQPLQAPIYTNVAGNQNAISAVTSGTNPPGLSDILKAVRVTV